MKKLIVVCLFSLAVGCGDEGSNKYRVQDYNSCGHMDCVECCEGGKPCGDVCISKGETCDEEPGFACYKPYFNPNIPNVEENNPVENNVSCREECLIQMEEFVCEGEEDMDACRDLNSCKTYSSCVEDSENCEIDKFYNCAESIVVNGSLSRNTPLREYLEECETGDHWNRDGWVVESCPAE